MAKKIKSRIFNVFVIILAIIVADNGPWFVDQKSACSTRLGKKFGETRQRGKWGKKQLARSAFGALR
jgi:hypothetical protein